MGWGEQRGRSAQMVAETERARAGDELAAAARRYLDERTIGHLDDLEAATRRYERSGGR